MNGWEEREPGESWVLKTNENIHAYIQPGGCLEITQINRGASDIVHLCTDDQEAIQELIDRWKNPSQHSRHTCIE